ncbi:putative non-muscle myosin heavy chain [Toxoplasma gondii VAND]|uniref:Putative non-muscle myosin heavy chain n=1 Tax=Toxoplasma gondii VAND TaxID=933077 RepID=A0A086PPM6_TOXGO|nr:putative non-muscle myosin heavy chain [Toxoplasma gondii VAND]
METEKPPLPFSLARQRDQHAPALCNETAAAAAAVDAAASQCALCSKRGGTVREEEAGKASAGLLVKMLRQAAGKSSCVCEHLCSSYEDVERASASAAELVTGKHGASVLSDAENDERTNSAGPGAPWKQQKLLQDAIRRQIDDLRAYAKALVQLSSSLTDAAAGAADLSSLRKKERNSQLFSLAAVVTAASASFCPEGGPEAEQHSRKSFVQLLERVADAPGDSAQDVASCRARSEAAALSLEDSFQSLRDGLESIQTHAERRASFVIRWAQLFVDSVAEVTKTLEEAAPLVARGAAWEKELDAQLEKIEEEKRALELQLKQAGRYADQVESRLNEKRHQFLMAIEDWTTERLDQLTKEERTQRLNLRIDALERQVRGLAAFSPLFIVERTSKYVTLQYKPLGSQTDYEISIEGLELSLEAQQPHAYKISSFFSVRVTPQLAWLETRLDTAIREYLSAACKVARSECFLGTKARQAAGEGLSSSDLQCDRRSARDPSSSRTVYDFSPYNVQQQELLHFAATLGISGKQKKRTREEAEGSQSRFSARGTSSEKRENCVQEERRTAVKIFSEHIAAILLKTLTTAFAANRGENRPRKYPPYNFVRNACTEGGEVGSRPELVTSS